MEEAQGQKVVHECIVHKANVPLAKGESLGKYTQRLSDDARKYVSKQLNIMEKNCSVYIIEAYADKAVVDVYQYPSPSGVNPSTSGTYKYYGVQYSRKSTGEFEFKNLTEVERMVSFQPKAPLDVTKGKKKAEEMEDEAELSSNKPKKTTKKEFMPGWESAEKAAAVWAGLL